MKNKDETRSFQPTLCLSSAGKMVMEYLVNEDGSCISGGIAGGY
jgi:hypothetical protein